DTMAPGQNGELEAGGPPAGIPDHLQAQPVRAVKRKPGTGRAVGDEVIEQTVCRLPDWPAQLAAAGAEGPAREHLRQGLRRQGSEDPERSSPTGGPGLEVERAPLLRRP